MPINSESLNEQTIDDVAVPWYERNSRWILAGVVAGGLVTLGRLRQKNLSENPLRSKDPKYWLGPLEVGDSLPVAGHADAPILNTLWRAASDSSAGLQDAGRRLISDAVFQLYVALGRPSKLPDETYFVLRSAINNGSGGPQWGSNIVNLMWLFEEAQGDSALMRWVWYAVHVPAIAALSRHDQIRIFNVIDALPPKQRWRVQWFFLSVPHVGRGIHVPGDLSSGPAGYHHGYLEQAAPGGYTLEEAIGLPYKKFLEKIEHPRGVGAKAELWMEAHEYEPKKQELFDLSSRAIVNFQNRDYLRSYRYLQKDKGLQEADRIRAAIGLSFTFGQDWKKWLDGMAAKGIDAHDATFWLPQEPVPGFGKFLKRRFLSPQNMGIRQVTQMNLIADRWNILPLAVRKDSTKNIIRFITSSEYENVIDEAFAEEAARWGVDSDEYSDMEGRFVKATEDLERSGDSIPSAEVVSGDLRLFKLDRYDPRGLFLGRHTACCQAPGLEAEECAWYGVESSRSAFYAVEDQTGTVVAQSWVWRNEDVIVYDNIEGPAIQSRQTRNQIIVMYRDLALLLLKADPTLLEVRIGDTDDRRDGGKRYIDWNAHRAEGPDIALIPPPFDFLTTGDEPYTDSSGRQFIFARADGGTKFFRGRGYMEFLAYLIKYAWEVEESTFHYDEDALETLTDYINASPFRVDYNLVDLPSNTGTGSYRRGGNWVEDTITVNVYLDSRGAMECDPTHLFSFDVSVTGKFLDLSLREFHTQIESYGRSDADVLIIEKLRIELDANDLLDADLPDEVWDWTGAPYLVSINMEEFKGYKEMDDAELVADAMRAVIDDDSRTYGHSFIDVLKKLKDDEVEEAREAGWLEDECYELQSDEFWCRDLS